MYVIDSPAGMRGGEVVAGSKDSVRCNAGDAGKSKGDEGGLGEADGVVREEDGDGNGEVGGRSCSGVYRRGEGSGEVEGDL